MIKALRFVALLSLLLISVTASAAYDDGAAFDESGGPLSPDLLVKKTADKVLTLVQKNRDKLEADPSGIYELVYKYVLPHFNFERMSRSVLGKHWHLASAEQRATFIKQFQILLVRTYAVALLNYSNEAITYLPFNLKPDAKLAQVKTTVSDGSGIDLPVNYLLYRMKQGDWKVIDVKIDGISLVSNYRTSFSSQVKRTGIAGLIKQLMARNAFLAQETGVTEDGDPSASNEELESQPSLQEETADEAEAMRQKKMPPAPGKPTTKETAASPGKMKTEKESIAKKARTERLKAAVAAQKPKQEKTATIAKPIKKEAAADTSQTAEEPKKEIADEEKSVETTEPKKTKPSSLVF